MMISCAQCGASLEDGASVCGHCAAIVAATEPTSAPAPFVPTFSFEPGLEGIGGWLILVAIGLAIAPLRSIYGIFIDLHVLYGGQFQSFLDARPGFAGLLLYELVTNTVFLIALALLNVLFYRKNSSFPWVMIGFLASSATAVLIDDVVTRHYLPSHLPIAALQGIVVCAVWIPYYLRSRRVKATFVR